MSAILSGEKMIITWGEIDWGENDRDSPRGLGNNPRGTEDDPRGRELSS